MTKIQIGTSLVLGLAFFALGMLKPERYHSEVSLFVPLTLMEKQIAQNGIGFGTPAEVDAHMELVRAPKVEEILSELFPQADFELEVSKTRNGAVLIEVWSDGSPERAAKIADATVAITDSLKQFMLQQNVGQSLDFVSQNLAETQLEMNRLQETLDSLRFEAVEDSLALASEVFKYERLYGSEVVVVDQLKLRKERLVANLKAPSPKSYKIHPATLAKRPSGIPAWAMGILVAALASFGFYIYNLQQNSLKLETKGAN